MLSLFGVIFSLFPLFAFVASGSNHQSVPTLIVLVMFVAIGQYFIWGRYIFDGWLKTRTYYGVTNRRLLIVQEGWSTKIDSTYLEAIPLIEKEGEGTGTLWFGPKLPAIAAGNQPKRNPSRFVLGGVPVFADIDDLDTVVRVVTDERDRVLRDLNSKS